MAAEISERELADRLVEWGFLTPEQAEDAFRQHRREGGPGDGLQAFAFVLESREFLTSRQLADARRVFAKGLRTCQDCRASIPVGSTLFGSEDRCPYCLKEQLPTSTELTAGYSDGMASLPLDVEEARQNPEARLSKYVLLGELGRGGFSVIHRAWDTEEKCYVALKTLRPASESEDAAREASELIHEAERAATLRHPYIIPVYEVGNVSGRYYMAMAQIEGYTLAELIASARRRRKISPFYDFPVRYLTILRDIARAVHYAHTRPTPLIHCDLKPSNIFIEISWTPYILDFGIAQHLNPSPSDGNSVVKGSPSYMAPEQILPSTGAIDATTDVYGLGAVLYDLLTGRPPFTGEIQEVLDKNLLIAPPAPSSIVKTWGSISGGEARKLVIPDAVEALCMRCLEKSKERRFGSALEVARELDGIIKTQPVTRKKGQTRYLAAFTPPPPSRGDRLRALARGRRARMIALVTAAILGLGAVGGAVYLEWENRSVEAARRERLQTRMDSLLAVLEISAAREGYRDSLNRDGAGQEADEWVEARLQETDAIDHLKESLIEFLNGSPPVIRYFRLRGRRLLSAEFIDVTDSRLEILSRGKIHEVSWSEIQPVQVLSLARLHKGMDSRARLGAALYAMKNDLRQDARGFLESLLETSDSDAAAALLRRLDSLEGT